MATYKKIAYAAFNAASDTSLTSIVPIPNEFDEYAIYVPALITATSGTCTGVQLLVEDANTTTTFIPVYTGQIIATITSNYLINRWATPASIISAGGMVECPAMRFCPGYAKFRVFSTVTMNTGITVYGRKLD